MGVLTAALLATAAPPGVAGGAQAVAEGFTLTMVEGGGQLLLRDFEPHEIQSPTTVSGSIDPETGVITDGAFSTPTVSVEQQITDPVEATVFIDAVFTGVTAATGSVDPEGTVVVQAEMSVDLHVEVGDPPFLTNDCVASPVNLTLASTTPYDPATGRVTLADTDFSVPQAQITPTCGGTVASAINEQLAGSGHALTLDLEGELTLPVSQGEPSTTVLAVDPAGQSRLSDPVTLTATVAPHEDTEATESPTGFVEFRNGAAVLGTVAVNEAGIAELTTSTLGQGQHSLSAHYRGDSVFAASVSAEVPHAVVVAPIATVTGMPEFVEYGAAPEEFDLSVTNPATGANVTNARIDVTFTRAVGNATLTPPIVMLETLQGGTWAPVVFSQSGNIRTVVGHVDATHGFELPPGATRTFRLRLAFPDVGGTPHPTACNIDNPTCPGPIRVTFDIVAVNPTSGEVVGSLSTIDGIVTLVPVERQTPVLNLPLGAAPHTVRQGNTVEIPVLVQGGRGGVQPTGCVTTTLDGVPVLVRSRGVPVEDGYVECLPVSQTLIQVRIAPDAELGPQLLTFDYPGDALFLPGQASTEITVRPRIGTPHECTQPGGVLTGDHIFGAGVEAQANVPAVVAVGTELDLDHLTVGTRSGRLGLSTDPLLGIDDNAVTAVGDDVLDGISFEFAPSGTGTAAALERTRGSRMPSTPYPAPDAEIDQVLEFHDATGTVVLDGAPGQVVPITLEALVVDFHLSGGTQVPFRLTCRPDAEPIIFGEVTLAGTTLSASASSAFAGESVTLTATALPATTGLMQFVDGSETIGIVPVNAEGVASVSSNDLTVGTHDITARFTPFSFNVPSTISDPVEVVVEPPEVTLTPSTGLVDQQGIVVTIANAAAGASYTLTTCKGTLCGSLESVTAPPGGTITTIVPAVQRFTATGGQFVYCRGDCEVVVHGPVDTEVRAPFTMAEGSLSVAPATGLADGDAVRVTATDVMATYDGPVLWVFETGGWLLVQCDSAVVEDPSLFNVFASCGLNAQGVTLPGSTLDVGYRVESEIDRILGGTTDCTAAPDACVVGLVRFEQDATVSHHFAPITFDG